MLGSTSILLLFVFLVNSEKVKPNAQKQLYGIHLMGPFPKTKEVQGKEIHGHGHEIHGHGHDIHGGHVEVHKGSGYGHDDHKGHVEVHKGHDIHDAGYAHDSHGHDAHGGGYGHDDHHSGGGYGHDDHHSGGGYGHDDHHSGGGYGHDDHHSGGGYVDVHIGHGYKEPPKHVKPAPYYGPRYSPYDLLAKGKSKKNKKSKYGDDPVYESGKGKHHGYDGPTSHFGGFGGGGSSKGHKPHHGYGHGGSGGHGGGFSSGYGGGKHKPQHQSYTIIHKKPSKGHKKGGLFSGISKGISGLFGYGGGKKKGHSKAPTVIRYTKPHYGGHRPHRGHKKGGYKGHQKSKGHKGHGGPIVKDRYKIQVHHKGSHGGYKSDTKYKHKNPHDNHGGYDSHTIKYAPTHHNIPPSDQPYNTYDVHEEKTTKNVDVSEMLLSDPYKKAQSKRQDIPLTQARSDRKKN